MKRFTLLSLFLMTVLFIGCSDSNSNPAKVAEKFTPSKDMSEMEKEAFKEMKKNLDEMKYVITPDNEDNVVEEDYYETTFIITSKKDADLKDKFNVSVEKGDDNKWRVTDFDID